MIYGQSWHSFWSDFELVHDFISVLVIWMSEEDSINNKDVIHQTMDKDSSKNKYAIHQTMFPHYTSREAFISTDPFFFKFGKKGNQQVLNQASRWDMVLFQTCFVPGAELVGFLKGVRFDQITVPTIRIRTVQLTPQFYTYSKVKMDLLKRNIV